MNFEFNDRPICIGFTKTVSANPNSPLENEITNEEIESLSADQHWWRNFIPRYFDMRGLKTTASWFNYQLAQSETRYPERCDLLISSNVITDLFTRNNMDDFPTFFGKIRIYAIETSIPISGSIDITIHLHKDA